MEYDEQEEMGRIGGGWESTGHEKLAPIVESK